MVEEIKLLLPVLEAATNGAIWAVIIIVLQDVVIQVIWVAFLVFLCHKGAEILRLVAVNDGERVRFYKLHTGKRLIASDRELENLLDAIGCARTNTVHSIDIRNAISAIKKANTGHG